MIIRVFRACVQPGANAAYERLIHEAAVPLMKQQQGLLALHVGRGYPVSPDEYVMVSVWNDMAAIQAFTGEHWQQAVVLPGEAHLVKETSVQHFEAL